jgi:hypothetical protein
MDGKDWKIDGVVDITIPPAVDQVKIRYTAVPVPVLSEDWGEVTVHRGGTTRTVRIGQLVDFDRVAIDAGGGQPYLIPMADLEGVSKRMP